MLYIIIFDGIMNYLFMVNCFLDMNFSIVGIGRYYVLLKVEL